MHTGGTIASKVDYATGAVVARFEPEELVASLPELATIAQIEAVKLGNMFSDDIRPQHWNAIVQASKQAFDDGCVGVVVTHGTDTLHISSAAVGMAWAGRGGTPPGPIAFVGSQRSSDRGSSDAAENLLCAVHWAANGPKPTGTIGDATVYTVAFENGDMSMNLDLAERIVIYDRGSIVGLRQGNDPVPTISFSVHLREFTRNSADTLLDFIYQTGNSSAATSTGGTGFEQFLCTVEFQANMSAISGSNTKVTFNKVLLFASVAEGNPDTISVTGEVYGSIVRAAV